MRNPMAENRRLVPNVVSINATLSSTRLLRPFITSRISAGFPSPAENELGVRLDFNRHFIKNQSSTYYVKVCGDSMIERRIEDGDVLLVDRAICPKSGQIVIARVNNDFCVRVYRRVENRIWLEPANKKYKAIEITPEMDFDVWGVVTLILAHPC